MCRTLLSLAAVAFLSPYAFAVELEPSLALLTPGTELVPETPLEAVPAAPVEQLSLEPPAHLSFASPLHLGPAQPDADGAILGQWRKFVQQDAIDFARQSPTGFDHLFDSLNNVFDAQDIEGPLGTLSTVHILPGNANTTGQILPFFALSQDADELDAHLRLGAGAGALYRFDDLTSLDAEMVYLQGTGDVNPQVGDETRFMLVFTHRF